jgi:hypothetical protein
VRHSFGVTLALERDARDDRTFAHSRDARHARAHDLPNVRERRDAAR